MSSAKTPTVLVPIDFSPASAAGLRFALQWATQQKIDLLCIHVISILHPTSWSDSRFKAYANAEKQRRLQQLRTFVKKRCPHPATRLPKISFLLIEAVSPEIALEEYCRRHRNIDFICAGTKGARGLKKLFGTYTGNLIMHSRTPVIAVPASYRRRPITRILYAADMIDYAAEIKRLLHFAAPLKPHVRVLHFNFPGDIKMKGDDLQTLLKKEIRYPFETRALRGDPDLSVPKNLQRHIAAFRPSVVVLFTHQDRPAFERLLYPGTAESLSFQLKTPLLVFAHTTRTTARRARSTPAQTASAHTK
jgi:nucleotide-binding universal stress UspA family protein